MQHNVLANAIKAQQLVKILINRNLTAILAHAIATRHKQIVLQLFLLFQQVNVHVFATNLSKIAPVLLCPLLIALLVLAFVT